MAAALKAQGNAHFAKKQWQEALDFYSQALDLEKDNIALGALLSNRSACYAHLDRFELALADASRCVKLRPRWSKGFAGSGEAYSRMQSFELAERAYTSAIDFAEDVPTKFRYVAALKTVKETAKRNSRAPQTMPADSPYADSTLTRRWEDSWPFKLQKAHDEGSIEMGVGLHFLTYAYQRGAEGWVTLDENLMKKTGTGRNTRFEGRPGSLASQHLSECILLDRLAFIIPPGHLGSDPSFSYLAKFNALNTFDFSALGAMRYFENRRWSAKEIVADLEKQRQREGWLSMRRLSSALTRGTVLISYIKAEDHKYGEAIQDLQLAVDILNEGNKVWSNADYDDKGHSFRPTMVRLFKVELMRYRQEGHLYATSDSAKKIFSLEAIEADAKAIVAENPQSEWSSDTTDHSRFAYYVLPNSRAYLALAYASAFRGSIPLDLNKIPSGQAVLADLAHAKKAARYYDLAYKLLPADYYAKPSIGYMALEQHLRAGGRKMSEIFRMAEEAEKIRKDLARIFPELNQSTPPRTFVETQVQSLRDWLEAARPANATTARDQAVKAIPTLNMRGTSSTFDPNTVLDANFWNALPGEVGVADILGLDREIRGTYA